MNAFDGAGPEYEQPRYRTILVLGLVIIILILAAWVVAAWGADLPQASPEP